MLSAFDDFPIHQTTLPVGQTATADLNHYDRYFFNGYTPDGSLFFAVAMGLYPNRHVVDAAFSFVLDGAQQVSVHASARAPDDRRHANVVGPIVVEVVEPMVSHRVVVDAPEHGVRAELTCTARSAPIEEPHFRQTAGVRVVFDYTRLTQFCAWQGWIEVDGVMHRLPDHDTWGSRDRSWGIRPVGERAPVGAPMGEPQFFWLWAPINFPDFSTHLDVNEYSDGRRWHETGVIAPVGDTEATTMHHVDYRLRWAPGRRYAEQFAADLVSWDGVVTTVELEPLFQFQMAGLGYLHPTRGHGVWRGDLDVGAERWPLPVDTPCAPQHIHVQSLVRARCGSHEGLGVLEQLAIGPHEPTGLTGLFDGYGSGPAHV